MARDTVEIEGHIVDSLLLAKVLDVLVEAGAEYTITSFVVGRTKTDPSRAVLDVEMESADALDALLTELQVHGVNRQSLGDAVVVTCEQDGVFPLDFYSTTNLDTDVRIRGRWQPVENPEMDCGLVVDASSVRTVPMHRVHAGDRVVVGFEGVRVHAPERDRDVRNFEFMNSDVSSEKPKALLVAQVAERMRTAHERDERILAVCGPAVVHTGGGPSIARLVAAGWIDVLFAGNGFATHDMESNVLGTSLGITVTDGRPVEHGHSNHLRLINEIRRHGSIAAAVDAGYLRAGVMYECVRRGVPFVLGGSVRDDGPLPDTMPDVVAAADAMRALVPGVGVALMLASTLHAIATGNLLPAGVETFCVDINQAVVTKLADRGSHQALGIVTDVGPFVRELADALC